jgi:2-C-methyl-D-erythritol 4-phosphate cytidylyltransferase
MSFHLVIPAAGSSSRFGANMPKQFLEYEGKALLLHALEAFSSFNLKSCTIAVAIDYFDYSKSLIKSDFPDARVVLGGDTRTDSVKNAINILRDEAPVLIHDAARPFVSRAVIERVLTALKTNDAVIPGIPCADTIKVVKDSRVFQSLERQLLKRIQTPQGFSLSLLKKAYSQISDFSTITDEAGLLEALGIMPFVVEGEEMNRKITFFGDLD